MSNQQPPQPTSYQQTFINIANCSFNIQLYPWQYSMGSFVFNAYHIKQVYIHPPYWRWEDSSISSIGAVCKGSCQEDSTEMGETANSICQTGEETLIRIQMQMKKWTQNFGAVLCPDTMNAMGKKGKYIPKIHGVNLCLHYHAKGQCFRKYNRVVTHVKLHGKMKQLYNEYSHAIHDKAERQGRITIKQNGKN